ncbi:ROK family protein [Eisenbergiella sp.]
MKIAVLDIGGTCIKAGIYENGSLRDYRELATDACLGGEHVMKKAAGILKGCVGFERIGISTAGQVDSSAGVIRFANSNIPGYTGMRIRDIMEKEFRVPAAVENDVNAAALGEAAFGAGRRFRDFLMLTYGTGVGGAVVLDGGIYTGGSFSAGEVGGMVVHGRQRDAQADMFSGCYERYASVTALVNAAGRLDASLTDGRSIFARLGEAPVREIVDRWIDEILYGLITLIHIFNPPCIILGGGVMGQAYIIEEIRKKLGKQIMPGFRDVIILPAQLGNTAGLLGAAKCAEGADTLQGK